mgnify:CR=1 FL=1
MSNDKTKKQDFSIGQFAVETGLSIDTLRFYEKKGLLLPARDVNYRRRYTAADIERVALIHRLQSGGFKLDEIRADLDLRGDGTRNAVARHDLLSRKLVEAYARRDEVQASIDYLEEKIAWLAEKM